MSTTDLRNTLTAAGSSAQYDADVKKILARKSILSRILAETVDEFMGMSPNEIEGRIEDNILISRVPTDSGLTNTEIKTESGDRIVGFNTEAEELAEGTAVFDIIFYVRTKDSVSQIIINVEAQRKEPSNYDLMNRAVFYAGRMISSQKERDFTGMNYNDMKRVFSIWICMNMEESSWNNVHLTNDRVLGNHTWKGKLDLIDIVLLGIPKKIPKRDEKYALHRMICALLLPDLTTEERMKILREEYQIRDDEDLRKELNEMCNLSEGIYEEGRQKGRQEGRREGVQEGRQEGRQEGVHEANIKTAERMIQRNNFAREDIAELTGLTLEEVEELTNLQPV